MKKFMKIYKIVVILLILFYILVLSTLTTLLGEWGVIGIVNRCFDDSVLGLIGASCGFYLLVKLTDLATWIIETKL